MAKAQRKAIRPTWEGHLRLSLVTCPVALYTATEGPTRLFNQRLKMLREAISTWEAAFDKAHAQGDQAGMKSADHHRQEHAEQIKTLMAFKAGLGRFCRTYAYVAQ